MHPTTDQSSAIRAAYRDHRVLYTCVGGLRGAVVTLLVVSTVGAAVSSKTDLRSHEIVEAAASTVEDAHGRGRIHPARHSQASLLRDRDQATVTRDDGPMRKGLWWHPVALLVLAAMAGAVVIRGVLRIRTMQAARQAGIRYEATMAERSRIAQVLHDTLLQKFQVVILELGVVRCAGAREPRATDAALERILAVATSAVREARQGIWQTRSHELEQDLPEALADVVALLVPPDRITVDVTVCGERRRLPAEARMALLRVGREAVANAVRHAMPSRVAVQLEYGAERVRLAVHDDGRGFDSAVAATPGHWGIRSIREHAARLGASLEIRGECGAGTRVDLSVPTPMAR